MQWLRQVHGATVVLAGGSGATGPGGAARPPEADAVVSSGTDLCGAVRTADCASIALGSREGVYAAVHGGWRGLAAGVVEEAVSALRSFGATGVVAGLGPCIHAECYEFSPLELDALAVRFGEAVRSVTVEGRPALDLPAAVRAALAGAGVDLVFDAGVCTACSVDHYSHRARREAGRQALFVWSDAPDAGAGAAEVRPHRETGPGCAGPPAGA